MWIVREDWLNAIENGILLNWVRHTREELVREVELRTSRWVQNVHNVNTPHPHIVLPERRYVLEWAHNDQYHLMYTGIKTRAKCIEVLWYRAHTRNTLPRELVVILKWQDDALFPEHGSIQILANCVYRIAQDSELRNKLEVMRERQDDIFKKVKLIDEKHKSWKMAMLSSQFLTACEERCKSFFGILSKQCNAQKKNSMLLPIYHGIGKVLEPMESSGIWRGVGYWVHASFDSSSMLHLLQEQDNIPHS